MSKLEKTVKRIFWPGVGQLGKYPPRPVYWPIAKIKNQAPRKFTPRITVVVPSLNQGEFIEATLQSIIDQQYANLELIIVDGGSTDNTAEVIKKYEAHLAWWVSEPDSGQAAAINKGFAKSTGEIMAWINSDDLMAPGALIQVVDHFAGHTETQVVYGNRILINEAGLEIGRWILPGHSGRLLKWIDFVPQETLYWTRKAWNLVDAKLDDSFQFAMDWDLLLRFSASKIKIERLPAFLGLFRVHQSQKTSAQMSSVGLDEMKRIHQRELSLVPSRGLLIMNALPYYVEAKCREIVRSCVIACFASLRK